MVHTIKETITETVNDHVTASTNTKTKAVLNQAVISERLITIGGEPFSTLVEFSSNSGLTETTGTFDKSMTDQIQLLVDTYKYLSVLFQVGLDITDEEGDAPSNDIFTAAKSEIDKTVWMLTAELGKEPGLK